MAKRKPTKFGELTFMIVFGALAYAVVNDALQPIFWVLLGLAVLGLWWFFAMPTKCDVLTNRGKQCQNDVRGKLGGCRWHAREKRDAIFAMFNMRNPGQMFRLAWSANAPVATTHPTTGESLTVSRRTAYEAIMLICTIASTVAGVAGTVFTAMTLAQS